MGCFLLQGLDGGATTPHSIKRALSTQILCATSPGQWQIPIVPISRLSQHHFSSFLSDFSLSNLTRVNNSSPSPVTDPRYRQPNMVNDAMDIETAEKNLKQLDHAEQHYFNRQVWKKKKKRCVCFVGGIFANTQPTAITIMVRHRSSSLMGNNCTNSGAFVLKASTRRCWYVFLEPILSSPQKFMADIGMRLYRKMRSAQDHT